MFLTKYTVGTRLTAGFSILVVLFLAVVAISIAKLYSMNVVVGEGLDTGASELGELGRAMGKAQGASLAMQRLIVAHTETGEQAQESKVTERLTEYGEAMQRLQRLFDASSMTDDEERRFLEQAAQLGGVASKLLSDNTRLGLGNDPHALEMLVNETSPALTAWTDLLGRFRDYEVKKSAKTAAEAHLAYASSRNTLIALGVAGLIFSLVLALVTSRSILAQLGGEPSHAQNLAQEIARGRLDSPVVLDTGDTSSLMFSLHRMSKQLQETVRGIRNATDHVRVASTEIAAGNADLSARTEQQAASLEETASSMMEITTAVRQSADNAKHASTLTTTAIGVVGTGTQAVDDMVATMSKISESSSKISEITAIIEGIAFQTNILALNAAVEAARAGEQGRGFAVVASEVRSLAQRSATAAREIKDLINVSTQTINGGAHQASMVSDSMSQIEQSMRQISEIIVEIAAAAEEQSVGIEEVNQAVGLMDSVTQQNAALVEQAAAAAKSLEDQAISLQGGVSVFQLA
ncbi:methyl-accepting chemotaxis protein [Burkholderia sp. Ax-1719]|uniref:methyl-accepting chemotaxis protein n=1 Tax=Burkholderia sp. Ax-1719 TaxID=2608334 RepID=UPI0014226E2A|nr:methyl-accepting chemotaxis protein [Burkholderia sp. Ax-1719]NIE63119.1 methyl-accepting chemotaxis protein [Burkholderia sp. Ax-1719]